LFGRGKLRDSELKSGWIQELVGRSINKLKMANLSRYKFKLSQNKLKSARKKSKLAV
jgi:hypothetical protein